MPLPRELLPGDIAPNEVEILRLGDHHGAEEDLTEQDLDDVAETYDANNAHEATFVIDHDYEYDREPQDRHRSGINHGLVTGLRRVKDSVVAQYENVTDELRNLVNSRRLNRLSPELYPRYRKTGKKYLRCVSFMGADTPAQKGLLKPVLFAEDDGEQFIAYPTETRGLRFAETEPKGPAPMTDEEKRAKKAAEAAAKKTADEAAEQARKDAATAAAAAAVEAKRLADEAAETARKEAEAKEPALAAMRSMLTEAVEAAVKPLRATIDQLQTQLANIDPQSGDHAVLAFAEKLVNLGIIEGKDKEREVARMKLLRGQTIRFGETAVGALEDYMSGMLSRSPVLPLGELPVTGPRALKFGEGDKAPAFEIVVSPDATEDDKKRLKALGKFAAERGIKTFGEASVAFERAEREGTVEV